MKYILSVSVLIILLSCEHKTDIEIPKGRVIVSDTKKIADLRAQSLNDSSGIDWTYDSTLMRSEFSRFVIIDSAYFNPSRYRSVFLSSEAFKRDSSLIILCSTKPDLVGTSYSFRIKGDNYLFERGWTDVVERLDTNEKHILEYFPMKINKSKFENGDTIYAFVIVKTATIKNGSLPFIEYLICNIKAVVQPDNQEICRY